MSITTISFQHALAVGVKFSCINLSTHRVAFYDQFEEVDILRKFVREITEGEFKDMDPELLCQVAQHVIDKCDNLYTTNINGIQT